MSGDRNVTFLPTIVNKPNLHSLFCINSYLNSTSTISVFFVKI